MPGFKQYGELPLYYANAGAFVHASTTEQWGLVVNEAMASGLPVLVSERCGCAPDLVETGRNGYTFDPHDVDALARLMLDMASDACDRAAMGRASREIVARWSPATFAEGFGGPSVAALDAPLPRPGLAREDPAVGAVAPISGRRADGLCFPAGRRPVLGPSAARQRHQA